MDCRVPPSVRVERSDDQIQVDRFFLFVDDFRLRIDGGADYFGDRPTDCRIPTAELGRLGSDDARYWKSAQARAGAVTADDAMYWCYETLLNVPEARAAIASRFDELIIDEAQDSNSFQVECLRLLANEGLPSLFLVGDFDQSIYSFQGAAPELCRNLASDVGLDVIALDENFRSSQLICNTTAWFRKSRVPDTAVGVNADFPAKPSIVLYEPESVPGLVEQFRAHLVEMGVAPDRSAVVARSQSLAAELDGRAKPKRLPAAVHVLLRCIRVRDHAIGVADIRDVENLLLGLAYGDAGAVREFERSEMLRDAAMKVMFNLPDLGGELGGWLDDAAQVLEDSASVISSSDEVRTRISDRLHVGSQTRLVDSAMLMRPARADGLTVATVHGVKGLSLGGIMVVAEHSPAWSGATLQADLWAGLLRQDDPTEASRTQEELRIVYVALTRAERVCRLALPASTGEDSLAPFVRAGFELASQ